MGEGDKLGDEVKKLSRLEREQEKVRIAQTNIDKFLAGDKKSRINGIPVKRFCWG